ncbi:MAG: dual specificity protein phosphatase family protein [Candidatus Sericytochromatia bacterium]|nr:dual specificity protein phosphatase family protein [Candidatus Sericytochromatia bacterium]
MKQKKDRAKSHLMLCALSAGCFVLVTGCGKMTAPGAPKTALTRAASPPIAQQARALEARQADEPGWEPTRRREDLGHFFKVDNQLYRGQQPTDQGLAQLRDLGIRHVVYLHFNKKQASHEKELVERLGMKFTHIPMSWILPPKQEQVDSWLKLTLNDQEGPVFVHCQHGRDRTGAMVGIYRIARDKWTFEQAYEEMKEKGFRTFFLGLSFGVKRYAKAQGATDSGYTDTELAFLR